MVGEPGLCPGHPAKNPGADSFRFIYSPITSHWICHLAAGASWALARGSQVKPDPIRKPDDDEARILYELYLQVFETHFGELKKREIMTHILGHEPWSFRVTAISRQACLAIARADFKKPVGLLARDHKRPRAKTFRTVFSRKHEFREWWGYVWEGDATVLVTREENLNSKPRGDDIRLDWKEGYFRDANIGWRHRKKFEGQKVKEICERLRLIGSAC